MIKKDRSALPTKKSIILPAFVTSFTKSVELEYHLLILFISLPAQSNTRCGFQLLATALPMPITFNSCRRKLVRFLLKQLTFEHIWLPILQAWLKADFLNKSSVTYCY